MTSFKKDNSAVNSEKMTKLDFGFISLFIAITAALTFLAIKGVYVAPEFGVTDGRTHDTKTTKANFQNVNVPPFYNKTLIMDTTVVYGSKSGNATKVNFRPSNFNNPIRFDTIVIKG